jgi:hypothetical protein
MTVPFPVGLVSTEVSTAFRLNHSQPKSLDPCFLAAIKNSAFAVCQHTIEKTLIVRQKFSLNFLLFWVLSFRPLISKQQVSNEVIVFIAVLGVIASWCVSAYHFLSRSMRDRMLWPYNMTLKHREIQPGNLTRIKTKANTKYTGAVVPAIKAQPHRPQETVRFEHRKVNW